MSATSGDLVELAERSSCCRVLNDPGGSEDLAAVASDDEDGVREAAEECPGECIFIEE